MLKTPISLDSEGTPGAGRIHEQVVEVAAICKGNSTKVLMTNVYKFAPKFARCNPTWTIWCRACLPTPPAPISGASSSSHHPHHHHHLLHICHHFHHPHLIFYRKCSISSFPTSTRQQTWGRKLHEVTCPRNPKFLYRAWQISGESVFVKFRAPYSSCLWQDRHV